MTITQMWSVNQLITMADLHGDTGWLLAVAFCCFLLKKCQKSDCVNLVLASKGIKVGSKSNTGTASTYN